MGAADLNGGGKRPRKKGALCRALGSIYNFIYLARKTIRHRLSSRLSTDKKRLGIPALDEKSKKSSNRYQILPNANLIVETH